MLDAVNLAKFQKYDMRLFYEAAEKVFKGLRFCVEGASRLESDLVQELPVFIGHNKRNPSARFSRVLWGFHMNFTRLAMTTSRSRKRLENHQSLPIFILIKFKLIVFLLYELDV